MLNRLLQEKSRNCKQPKFRNNSLVEGGGGDRESDAEFEGDK